MRNKKWLWFGGSAFLLGILGVIFYIFFVRSTSFTLWKFTPPDAAFIIETDNVMHSWTTLRDNKIWQSLQQDPLFKDIHEQAAFIDSMLTDYPKLQQVLKHSPMFISCHLIAPNDYDFLFIVDLNKFQWVSLAKDFIFSIASNLGYPVEKENFEGEKIYTIQSKTPLFVSLVGNIALFSYTKSLVQHAILTSKQTNPWDKKAHFSVTRSYLGNSNLTFYFFQPFFSQYLAYFTEEKNLLQLFSSTFTIGNYNVSFDSKTIRLKGALHLSDSSFSLLHALNKVGKNKIYSYSIVPDNAALYVSLAFENFDELLKQLKSFSDQDTSLPKFEPYQRRIQKALKLFGIDVEKLFFSWIGNEIAMVKLPPAPNVAENDLLFIFHSNDINKAYEGLQTIAKKVSRWIPVKEKTIEYKGFTLHYFGLKGFFKLFFGNLFNSLEKPYYLIVEDFVVFSNSPTLLMIFIDQYLTNHTFQQNDSYTDFISNLSEKTNIRVILQGPRAFQHVYRYATPNRKKDVLNNQPIFTSFKYLGVELYRAENNIYKSNIYAYYDEDASYETALLDMERDAEDLYLDELDSILSVKFPETSSYETFTHKIYYPDDSSKLLAEGKITKGEPTGFWRFYYPSGNLWATIPFADGKPDGTVMVYYNEKEPKTKISCSFKDGNLDHTYIEYYKNGKVKAKLEFDEGLKNGEALFFYESGNVKIEGQYKHGEKTGSWKYYTETGDLLSKDKWKAGKRK